MRVSTLVATVALMLGVSGTSLPAQKTRVPETFTANLQAAGGTGGAGAATIQIDIRRYTPAADLAMVQEALKTGGYPSFVTALRKAPEVGAVSFGNDTWAIRWAREQPSGTYTRTIVVVTDQPIFFVGGGRVDAKPREGYQVAVIQMEVDSVGLGRGTMTAAARVKPDGEGGVKIDDYAEKPIKLITVTRKIQ